MSIVHSPHYLIVRSGYPKDEDYEGPPKESEDMFMARLQRVVTDAEASIFVQKAPTFKRVDHENYRVLHYPNRLDN